MAKGDSAGLYTPTPYSGSEAPDLARWVTQELYRISQSAEVAIARQVDVLNATPSKPRIGQLVYADGTNFNPGSGAGPYIYTGTSWLFLGVTAVSGMMFDFGGTATPTGYLACDGSNVSRATYAALFAAIGTTWGAGDGSTTFGLPDFRRRVAVGSGGSGTGTLGNAVGNTGGEETHVLTTAELASHTHTGTSGGMNSSNPHSHSISGPTYASPSGAANQSVVGGGTGGSGTFTLTVGADNANIDHTHGFTTDATGSGTGHNTIQPSAVVLKVIKT